MMVIADKLKDLFALRKKNGIRAGMKTAYNRVMESIPLKDAIVFECESDMDDNPRAFYEYLIQKHYNEKYRMIWIVKNTAFCERRHKCENVDFVSRFDKSLLNRMKLKYYLATSKWFIFSHPWWFEKLREEQRIIHVGHGTPIKQASKKNNRHFFDDLLVPTQEVVAWYTQFWHCDKEKTFICGLPRNDLLWKGNKNKKEILEKFVPQYTDEAVIMCMPTFRQAECILDSEVIDCFSLGVVESKKQFDALNDALKERRIHLIVKPHPLQKMEYLQVSNASNIHYYQNCDLLKMDVMLYELLGCCDALLSDVSSVVFDYLLLNRPIGFFMNNYSTYTRGYLLEDPTEYMPGEYIHSFEQLVQFVHSFSEGKDTYADERMKVSRFVNGSTTGDQCYCEALANWIWGSAES